MARPPDILLSVADDQRHSALGCSGLEPVGTPRLDALAAAGVRLTQARHAGSMCGAVCAPSRGMLHTGRGPFGLPREMLHVSPPGYCVDGEAVTLAQRLRAAGYHTHVVGKWHNERPSLLRGFDAGTAVFLGGMADPFETPTFDFAAGDATPEHRLSGVHAVEHFADAAERVVARHRAGEFGDKPLFLYVAWTSPHDPRTTHRQFHDLYDPADVELPPNCYPRHPFDNGASAGMRDELLAPLPRDPDEVRRHVADYRAMVTHLDAGVGRVLDAIGGDALRVHTADHGLAVGQHGLMGKQNLYEHSVRVPLIAAGPGVAAGTVADDLCYQHDLFPTLLEAAGDTGDTRGPFRSLWPVLRGGPGDRHHVGGYYARHMRYVTDGRHKLIAYPDRTQCFDLAADPHETTDLGRPAWSGELADALRTWQSTHNDPDAAAFTDALAALT